MYILTLLYTLFIAPLELLFELIYVVAYRILHNPGLAIVFLSLAMNFLVLPLYRRADAMQEEERERSIRMKPWADHIKNTFKGDEKFMIMQAYNRQNGYKPTDALKGSLSLLLEIPFFIAAYHFLSNLDLLHGASFGPLVDLGAPDALLSIGGFSINLLPLLMTALNLMSAVIYMKGLPLSNKIQMFGIAGIFLVLLYNSPSGLVFYWTLNNLFSLVKNVFYRLPNPHLVLAILSAIVGILLPYAIMLTGIKLTPLRIAIFAIIGVGLFMPFIFLNFKGGLKKVPQYFSLPDATPEDGRTFFFACLFLAILTGFLIPTAVISASPAEFVNNFNYRSPLWLVGESFALALGTFVVWFSVFYHLATPKIKTFFIYFVFALGIIAAVNYLFFGTNYGEMSTLLEYDTPPTFTLKNNLLNAALVLAIFVVTVLICKKKTAFPKFVSVVMVVAVSVMTAMNIYSINTDLSDVKKALDRANSENASIPLSKDGKNVVVIMLDRAISYYVPYLMNEKAELREQFAGFTFYSNTVSYGVQTNTGSPPLYGGFDYTPAKMNERDNMLLEEKHNEALKVMPTLFSQQGYSVTLFDPSYAGYGWIPDLTVFDDIPNTNAYITLNGYFATDIIPDDFPIDEYRPKVDTLASRNYFCFGLFKTAPLIFQKSLYNNATYNSALTIGELDSFDPKALRTQRRKGTASKGWGNDELFLTSYGVLQSLPSLTKIEEGSKGSFFMMVNDITHSPTVLKEPEYEPEFYVDNTEYDKQHPERVAENGDVLSLPKEGANKQYSKLMHYQVNMAAFLKLGEWFDYLRENGVYDNTRIILVSDHARRLTINKNRLLETYNDSGGKYVCDTMTYECLFMVKDFDSQEYKTNTSFMTNADTPMFATEGVIDNPRNPFTGSAFNEDYKNNTQYLIYTPSPGQDVKVNNGYTWLPASWITLEPGNVHDPANWKFDGWR